MNTKITREMLDNLNIDFINDIPYWTLLGKEKTDPSLINITSMEDVRKMIKYLFEKKQTSKIKESIMAENIHLIPYQNLSPEYVKFYKCAGYEEVTVKTKKGDSYNALCLFIDEIILNNQEE